MRPRASSPPDAPAVQLGLDAFEEVLGVRPLLIRSGGAHPARLRARHAGVPTILTGFALNESNIHSPNERIPAAYLPLGHRRRRSRCYRAPGYAARATRPFSSPLAAELVRRGARALPPLRPDRHAGGREAATTYPSTAKQLDLSRLLVDELREIGLDDVELTEHGYVFATLPGTVRARP